MVCEKYCIHEWKIKQEKAVSTKKELPPQKAAAAKAEAVEEGENPEGDPENADMVTLMWS